MMRSNTDVVRTLGVDLASQSANTGVCVVVWGDGTAQVELPSVHGSDQEIHELQGGCDHIGIDMPFGWPETFVKFVSGRPGGGPADWSDRRRDELRFRRTDQVAREETGRWPLSVSSDRIAIPAMRCAGLLTRMGVANRAGDGRVFEVYPAAALARWGFASRGYKGAKGKKDLVDLVARVFEACPWLEVDDSDRRALEASDDVFDALICALVARAAGLKLTEGPPAEDLEVARREGWIHMPVPGSLGWLVERGLNLR